ncbi:MAG: hypothetical protein Q9191_002818 [Dirinaria sp. TL-2023a]
MNYKLTVEAEITLLQEEKQPGFSVTLLQIVATPSYDDVTRLATSLYFKNFIRKWWTDEQGNHKLPQGDVQTIKHELIALMTSAKPSIQFQLGEAIAVIADSDFWDRWDTLVDDLVSRLNLDDLTVNNGVLQVGHTIFSRWRPLYRSDRLFTEINHVLEKFGEPFLIQLQGVDSRIEQNRSNKEALSPLFAALNLLMKLLYDLSIQDLPPIFEDNFGAIMSLLHKYVIFQSDLLETNDESQAGPLELVKSEIFMALSLYAQKFDEDFGPHVGEFVESSWNLLTTIGSETKYDILVSRALGFLTSVTNNQKHAQNFNEEAIASQVIEKVILPNIVLRDSDVELLEDDPIEYIRNDLEGLDSETRRRAAIDFLKQLLAHFPQMITNLVFRYIHHFLSEYSVNPKANWKSKDTAIYLFVSLAVKGTITASQGAKNINELVDVVDFFQKNVAKDLISDTGIEPILKVDAIKYLYIFRSQISQAQWHDAFPLLVKHLGSSEYVIYSYAALALERVMALYTDAGQPVIRQDSVKPLSDQLLQHLFKLIEKDSNAAKMQENEFLMRCLMRVLIVIRDGVIPMVDRIFSHLVNITHIIAANPSNPRFYYYHFEAIGALVRFAAPSEPERFENQLYDAFAGILYKNIEEFVPYIFQILAAALESNRSANLPPNYVSLIGPVLNPQLWLMRGNVPALVRLLTDVIPRAANEFARADQLEQLLAIFQRLVSTKINEIQGFELLECIIANIPVGILATYFQNILQLLLTRLQNSKTEVFTQRFVHFYHFVSARADHGLGADFFISASEQLQEGIFVQLYLTIILPTTENFPRPSDRKAAVISFTRTLISSNAFAQRYKKGWALTVQALLKLLANPPLPPAVVDIIVEQDVDDMSFGVGFTQLTTIKKPVVDPWPEITDVKAWVSQELRKNARQMAEYAQERPLDDQAKRIFASYVQG